MKVGMNMFLWCNRLEPAHFPLLGSLKMAGFDGVEIPMSDYSSAELSAIRSALHSEGLQCTMASILSDDTNPVSPDAATRQSALHKLQSDIDIAAELGAESLVGPFHSAHKLFQGRGPEPDEFEHCVSVLTATAAHAEAAGVKVAVEPLNRFECYFLNTAAQAKKLADAVDSPALGILYDTHHANIEENDVYAAIVSLDTRLNHVHVSESHRGTPGTGSVNWHNSFEALRDTHYDGWVVIEAFAQDVPGLADAVNIWRDCFGSKTEVYEEGIALIRSGMNA